MVKIEVDIPEAEFGIFKKVAEKLGVPVQMLVQQEVDQAIVNMSVWSQRVAELLA